MNSSASLPALHGVTGLSVFPVVNSLCAFNLLEYSEASKVTINTSKFFSVTELHKPIWTAAGVLALSNSVPQGIARSVPAGQPLHALPQQSFDGVPVCLWIIKHAQGPVGEVSRLPSKDQPGYCAAADPLPLHRSVLSSIFWGWISSLASNKICLLFGYHEDAQNFPAGDSKLSRVLSSAAERWNGGEPSPPKAHSGAGFHPGRQEHFPGKHPRRLLRETVLLQRGFPGHRFWMVRFYNVNIIKGSTWFYF